MIFHPSPRNPQTQAEALSIEEFITLFSQLRPLEALSTGEGEKTVTGK